MRKVIMFLAAILLCGFTTSTASDGKGKLFPDLSNPVDPIAKVRDLRGEAIAPGIKLLHSFAGGVNDGARPTGSLILLGSTLYGMTGRGGGSDLGTVFKMGTSGTGFALLHEFAGYANNDGAYPLGSLVFSGSTLYGMTHNSLFKIQTGGGSYAKIGDLGVSFSDAQVWPVGSLVISGSTLYVMEAGAAEWTRWYFFGSVNRYGTDGQFREEVRQWDYDSIDPGDFSRAGEIKGSLILSGSVLYGLAQKYGSDGKGGIFKVNSDGSDFIWLHLFDGGAADGEAPLGSLFLSGSTLYGMTQVGGAGNRGSIFRIRTDGSGFALLHSFSFNISSDEGDTVGTLILSGSTLYGMTAKGGTANKGTIFKIQTNGNDFALLHSFAGGAADGAGPVGSLVLAGSTLYGMTSGGGVNDRGTVFSLALPAVAVTSPNGGEQWIEGDTHDITWTSTGTFAKVNIDYSTNNGGNWTPVVAGTANDGSYSWTVPNTPSTACLARISDAANVAMNDTSNAVFSILMSLDLLAERHEIKAFSIVRQYGQINFLGGSADVQVAQYRIMRRKGSDDFTLLRTVAPSELQDNQFQLQDKYLEKGISYIYRVEAYDAAGQLIGLSLEKTI